MRIDRVPGGCLLLAMLVVSAAPTAGAAAADHPVRAPRYVPDELVVRFKPGVSAGQRADARRDRGATVERALSVPRAQLLDLEGSSSVRAAQAAFEGDPRVDYAEPNYLVQADSNDQYFASLWGLENLGGSGGILDADIDAPEAWAVPIAAGDVRVAVVDTGVTLDHPDLAGRLVPGHDFVDGDAVPADLALDDPTTADVDPVAHGTHVAGTIGAVRDNGIGGTGVASQVDIMPLRALDWYGIGSDADVADAFARANQDGARIVNASLSSSNQANVIHDAIAAATDTLFVVAAGNNGRDNDASPRYPCNESLSNVLCVAASDRADARASFSNWGRNSVDIAAPGVSTLSTFATFDLLKQELFEGGALPAGWIAAAPWSVSAGAAGQGNFGLGAARGPSDSDSAVATASVDLTGKHGCQLLFDLRMDVAGSDVFTVERKTGPSSWTAVFTRSADTSSFATFGADVPGGAPLELRFRYRQQGSGPQTSGVAVDFFEVYCTTPGYASISGTSMATPHVTGAAALVLAQNPAFTPAQVKDRLLTTGDPSACWTDRTVTGRRLNVARALGAEVGPGPTDTTCGGGGAAAAPAPAISQPAPSTAPPPTGTGAQPPTTDGGASADPETAAADRTAPTVELAVAPRQRLARVLGTGLRAGVRCSERCAVTARLYARSASGRALLVGRSARVRTRGGRATLRIGLSSRGRRLLRGGPRRQSLTLSLSASDGAGNERKLRRRVSLRR